MAKKILALCGKEEFYYKRMFEYALNLLGEDFEVVLFTDEGHFKDFYIEHPVEMVIADEGFVIEENEKITVLARLSEEPGAGEAIYKYKPCDEILKEVMARCAKISKTEPSRIKEKSIIGVYTPIKRCFQTSFAIALGQILAKNHKVLYLNFEGYSGFEILSRARTKTDLMDLVYFSECEEDDFSYRVGSIKERLGNLDYISPIKAFVRFSDVTKEQWEKLLSNLVNQTDYDYFILDLSEHVNGLLSILSKCSRIYTITDKDRIASAKVAQYENLLRMSAYDDVLEKTENIVIPKFKEIPNDFEMLPFSELADYIKRLIKYQEEKNE